MSNNLIKEHLSVLIVFRMNSEQDTIKLVQTIITNLKMYQTIFFFMDKPTAEKMAIIISNLSYRILDNKEYTAQIDLVITVGGDGTILYAAKQFDQITPPFLTFQKGTLGFLCKFCPVDVHKPLEQVIDHLIRGKPNAELKTISLMRISVEFAQNNNKITRKILNEVAITRKDCKLVVLQIYINDEYITTTSGDGILVSTPTGSTAYSLSAGGPVVLNGVNTIILVPIAPNSLSFRPICLPSTSVTKIKLSQKSKSNAIVSFDGQSNFEMSHQDQIVIYHQKNCDLILYEATRQKNTKQGEQNLPSWMQRLKLFLGWNQVFKSPTCHVFQRPK